MLKTQILFNDNEPFQYSMTFEGAWRDIEPLKDAFKAAVPPSDRKWNNEEKSWLFTEDHLDTVITLARGFGDVEVE